MPSACETIPSDWPADPSPQAELLQGHPLEADPPREMAPVILCPQRIHVTLLAPDQDVLLTKRSWQPSEAADLGICLFIFVLAFVYLFAHNAVVRSLLLLQGSCLQCITEATT